MTTDLPSSIDNKLLWKTLIKLYLASLDRVLLSNLLKLLLTLDSLNVGVFCLEGR